MVSAWLLLVLVIACCRPGVGQNIYEGSTCKISNSDEGTCVKLEECPEAKSEVLQGRLPQTCSFEGFKAIVCCANPTSNPTPIVPLPAPRTPTSTSRRSVPANDTSNERRISEKKCHEYGQYVYELVQGPLHDSPKMNVSTCGLSGSPFIAGGMEVKSKEFPHMAAIGFGKKENVLWRCGGSLISERFILTAAHCVDSVLGKPRWVRLGILDVKKDTKNLQEFTVKSSIVHPEYRSPIKYNDIALLELDRDAELNGYVRPACLHTTMDIPFDKATATGWGKVDYNLRNSFSDALLKVSLLITTHQHCYQKFAELPPSITSNVMKDGVVEALMLCAGEPEGGKGTCGGDSGGPLQIRRQEPDCTYNIIAVTSFGRNCAQKDSPTVFTRVSNYVPWIESVVWPGQS